MYGLKFLLEMKKQEITYEYLARRLNVASKGTIGNWVCRQRVPNEEHVNILAKELGVEPHYINKQLTKEEQEWLKVRDSYRKLQPQYEEITIEYYDEDTQELHKNLVVLAEVSESKHEKEILWSNMENEQLKHKVIQFVNQFNSMDEEHSARCILYQIMDSVGVNEDKIRLISTVLEAVDKTLSERKELIGAIIEDRMLVNKFATNLAKEVIKSMTVDEW